MFRRPVLLKRLLFILLAPSTAALAAGPFTVTVPSTTGPWSQAFNPAFSYGIPNNTPPVAINSSNGISFTLGATITVAYLSGAVAISGHSVLTDANGDLASGPTNTRVDSVDGALPAFFMAPSTPVYFGELVGTFANNGLIVGKPFAIGDGPAQLTIPSGATELLLGINDNYFADNVGEFQVQISTGCQVNVSSWLQFTPWGGEPYDHSYVANQRSLTSKVGNMELRIAAPPVTGITSFSFPTENTFTGLANEINGLDVGVFAVPSPTTGPPFTYLALYNTGCIGGANCYPSLTHLLQLCYGTCDSNPNLLTAKTMGEYGCLLTALAICLQFSHVQEINTLTGPMSFDPEELNKFMSNTESLLLPGGWFKTNADVNYRTTPPKVGLNIGKRMLQFDDFGNGTDSVPTLPGVAENALDRAICTNHVPIIVGVKSPHTGIYPGHYVVVTSKQGTATDGSEYAITDPGYPAKMSLASYDNQFQIVGTVRDPAGDLSQLVIDIAVNANVMVIDASGRRTGFDPSAGQVFREIPNSTYSKSQIVNDVTGADSTGADYSIGIGTPAPGPYRILVSGLLPGPYTLEVHPYSLDGTEQPVLELRGIAVNGSSETFQVQYASTPGVNSQAMLVATFQSTIQDISNSLQMNWIDNNGIANSLSQKLQAASSAAGPARANILNAFNN